MAQRDAQLLEHLRTVEAEYKDNRLLDERDHRALVWFFVYVQNAFSQFDREWVGASFRQRGEICNLVVKSRTNGTQQVAFVTGRTPTVCVRIFARKWYEDRVEWHNDKYV